MPNELPIPVQNLRKIWASKKVEMRFNQTEAAKTLGWSQGAISHYLCNQTELGALAVVKLANFLGVDPTEIDPAVVSKLPNIRQLKVTKKADDITKTYNDIVYSRDDLDAFYVELNGLVTIENHPSLRLTGPLADSDAPYMKCYARLCAPKVFTSNTLIAARLKKEKRLRFYLKSEAPDPKTVHTKWAVISMYYQ